MRQSFEEFLKNKYEHYRKGKKLVLYFDAWMSDLGIAGISQYAEEWSSQQPEDKIKHGMAFTEKSIEQEVTELVHTTFGGAEYYNSFIPKLMEILAKRKEEK